MFKLFRNFSCSAKPQPPLPQMENTGDAFPNLSRQMEQHHADILETSRWNDKMNEEAIRDRYITDSDWYEDSKEEFILLLTKTLKEEQEKIIEQYSESLSTKMTKEEIADAAKLKIILDENNRIGAEMMEDFGRINNNIVGTMSILERKKTERLKAAIHDVGRGGGLALRVYKKFYLKLSKSKNQYLRLFKASPVVGISGVERWSISFDRSSFAAAEAAAASIAAATQAHVAADAAAQEIYNKINLGKGSDGIFLEEFWGHGI